MTYISCILFVLEVCVYFIWGGESIAIKNNSIVKSVNTHDHVNTQDHVSIGCYNLKIK